MPVHPDLLAEIYWLAASVRALAAVGASLRARRSDAGIDEKVRRPLDACVGAVLPDGVELGEHDGALEFIDLFFEEAADILHSSTDPPVRGAQVRA